ncbi:MAG: ABC transporter ATP-binding protein [Nitrospina sp.]|jgi:iron complex transport system ATP-binding protein|nr:ABC transporter ATP-binding protein [Nitrospina sp.]MBT3414932.1 ABC transporter ATP-binding protein [Nitrospina sp.]MBT3857289.1 ABC transporter ATP-binding protein [Nitrospina sp.]MBT4103771.1 ABC transporter ATP-binding protein [Nitrospina sp.]MBT4389061.1 ABC transporter ATP-binding protein [Nitrospina sp.]
MTPALMKLENISFAYETLPVLKDISLSTREQDFIGLIGPNGSGKSTLLKIMGAILKPDSGSIQFKESSLPKINKKLFAQSVSWIPQDHPMVFPFKVSEIVLMGRHPYLSPLSFESEEDFEISQRAMETTMTSQFADRYFNEISGGEKQRVMIASALAQDPEMMLLDEPTAALDLKYQIQILSILKNLNARHKMTLVMAMHDLNLASSFCNRLILLDEGQIVRDGTPEQVLKKDILEQVYGIEVDLGSHDGSIRVHPVISR